MSSVRWLSAHEAAGYLLYDPVEETTLANAGMPGSITAGDKAHLIPLVIQDTAGTTLSTVALRKCELETLLIIETKPENSCLYSPTLYEFKERLSVQD